MTRKTLFVEQDVSPFTEQKMYDGLYGRVYNFPESEYDDFITDYFIIEPGESYLVEWDGKEYEVVAHDGSSVMDEAVFLGNATMFGFDGNNEPFLIGWIPTGGVFLSTTETTTSHTIAIYQYVSDGIVIKNPNGRSITYGEYNKLLINRASGEKTIYSMGEAENGTVELDFSKGDMTVKPDEGKLWNEVEISVPEGLVAENIVKGVEIAGVVGSRNIPVEVEKSIEANFLNGDMSIEPEENTLLSKVTIQKPTTLIPEHIAEGVDIAGIIGTLTGGSGVLCESGSFSGNGSIKVVNHNLGVTPDIVIVYTAETSKFRTERQPLFIVGMTSYCLQAYGFGGVFGVYGYGSTKGTVYYGYQLLYSEYIDMRSSTNTIAFINSANETSFTVGNSDSYKTISGITSKYIAIKLP